MPHVSVNLVNAQQENPFWCWAAVASNVYDFLSPAAPKTQCDVAKSVNKNCAAPELADLENALSALNILSLPETLRQNFFDKILSQLTHAVPVCAEIGFADGPHHFVAIVGVDQDSKHVWIADPFPGGEPIEFAFDDFCDRYTFAPNQQLGAGEKNGEVIALFLVHKP